MKENDASFEMAGSAKTPLVAVEAQGRHGHNKQRAGQVRSSSPVARDKNGSDDYITDTSEGPFARMHMCRLQAAFGLHASRALPFTPWHMQGASERARATTHPRVNILIN
jgi:hypothetical protein